MYKYLETNESFTDLRSDTAKVRYAEIMHALDNIPLPDIPKMPYYPLTTRRLSKKRFEDSVNYLCDKVFLEESNNLLAKEVFTNRTTFSVTGYPYGFTSYDTSAEKLIDIEGAKYQISPALAVHELAHAILLLHEVPIPKAYEEVLSIFIEIMAVSEMGETVYDEWLFNKLMQRLSYRIYLIDLSDESLESHKIPDDVLFQGCFRIINLIYALRLYELYTLYPDQVYQDINDILNNKNSISNLLRKYDISLDSEETVLTFEKIMNKYEIVLNKYFSDRKRA